MRRHVALIVLAVAAGITLALLASGLVRNALIHRDWSAPPTPVSSQSPPSAVKMTMPLIPHRFTVVR